METTTTTTTNTTLETYFTQLDQAVNHQTRNLPPQHDREDVRQDASVKLLRLRKEKEIKYPNAYISSIVRNTITDHIRIRRETSTYAELQEPQMNDPNSKPAEYYAIRKEEKILFNKAIRKLPEEEGNIIKMITKGMNYREIGTTLGTSAATISRRVGNMRKLIEQTISP